MTSRTAALLVVALAGASCRHVRHVPEPEPQVRRSEAAPPAGHPRVPADPEGLLGKREVEEVQRALARRGLLGEHQAGEIDEPTSRALERFQRAQGLASTGFPDRATLRRLGIDPEQAYRAAHRPHPERPPQQGTGSGSSR